MRALAVDLEVWAKATSNVLRTRILLTNNIRLCSRPGCRKPTRWMKALQATRQYGWCLAHVYHPSAGSLADAEDIVMDVFPAATVRLYTTPQHYAPGEYAAPAPYVVMATYLRIGNRYEIERGTDTPVDAGPCAGCGTTIRLFGPYAHPLCAACERRRHDGGRRDLD
jgi:hypothetical protein